MVLGYNNAYALHMLPHAPTKRPLHISQASVSADDDMTCTIMCYMCCTFINITHALAARRAIKCTIGSTLLNPNNARGRGSKYLNAMPYIATHRAALLRKWRVYGPRFRGNPRDASIRAYRHMLIENAMRRCAERSGRS